MHRSSTRRSGTHIVPSTAPPREPDRCPGYRRDVSVDFRRSSPLLPRAHLRRDPWYKANTAIYNIADGSSPASVGLAEGMADAMGFGPCPTPPVGQTAGAAIHSGNAGLLAGGIREGWAPAPRSLDLLHEPERIQIALFDQFDHLSELRKFVLAHREIEAAIGRDYLVTPDIVVGRRPVPDAEINAEEDLIGPGDQVAQHTSLREANERRPILHASIACKWTMRSDRAQNTRTEALNLIRNRKGCTPHIVAVTLEPLPGRLASIAMGTGDVDCTYHGALNELLVAAADSDFTDSTSCSDPRRRPSSSRHQRPPA